MKFFNRRSLISVSMVVSGILSVTGCSKDVSKQGGRFGLTEPQIEPTSAPTSIPTSTPTSTPSPLPSGGPSPRPSTSPSPAPSSVSCDPSALGELPTYAIYVREDLNLNSSHISGRVFADDATVTQTEMGTALVQNSARVDLAVAHDLSLQSSKVLAGRTIYGRTYTGKNSSSFGGFSHESTRTDSDFSKMMSFLTACGAATPNTTVTRTCVKAFSVSNYGEEGLAAASEIAEFSLEPKPEICTLRIRGTDKKLNIATLTLGQLAGTNVIQVDIPAGSVLVSNTPTLRSATFKKVRVRSKASAPGAMFWNFSGAEDLNFNATHFLGTVVAPFARVGVCGQSGVGGFWARELTASESMW